MDKNLLELYSDYLLCSFGATTATGLSALLEGVISLDRVTRSDDGVLIIDDTIQEKPQPDENDLICWHFDHTKRRMVKGINLLNCVYHAGDVSLPVTYPFTSASL